jgi:hypothetical protein
MKVKKENPILVPIDMFKNVYLPTLVWTSVVQFLLFKRTFLVPILMFFLNFFFINLKKNSPILVQELIFEGGLIDRTFGTVLNSIFQNKFLNGSGSKLDLFLPVTT